MPDDEVIKDLKDRYKKIFAVSIKDTDYIFRQLTIGEFTKISSSNTSKWQAATAEDEIIDTVLLWPEELKSDDLPAGIISSLAEQILEASGFDDDIAHLNSVLEHKRLETESFQKSMMAFIIAAMPAYKMEDLLDFTFEELLNKLALSESILRIKKDVYNPQIIEIKLDVRDPNDDTPVSGGVDPIAQKLMSAPTPRPAGPSFKVPRGTSLEEVQTEYE